METTAVNDLFLGFVYGIQMTWWFSFRMEYPAGYSGGYVFLLWCCDDSQISFQEHILLFVLLLSVLPP